jgi:hypothetical protein
MTVPSPKLDGEKYIRGDNWLGVALASLMKLPRERIRELGSLAFLRLNGSGLNEQQTFLLDDCFGTYLDVDVATRREISGTMQSVKPSGDSTMRQNKSMLKIMFEEGQEEGRELGLRLGRLELIEAQLDSRFGTLSESVLAALRGMTDAEIRSLAIRLPKAETLAELGL